MEKLIELLDEYEKIDYHIVHHKIKEWEVYRSIWNLNEWIPIWWYSKSFWFIKWLVDNDKIDFYEWKYLENPIWSNNYDECDYLKLIQWLAISDTPIEDLISYLK